MSQPPKSLSTLLAILFGSITGTPAITEPAKDFHYRLRNNDIGYPCAGYDAVARGMEQCSLQLMEQGSGRRAIKVTDRFAQTSNYPGETAAGGVRLSIFRVETIGPSWLCRPLEATAYASGC